MPTPKPPTIRKATRTHRLFANPLPSALTRKSTAAIRDATGGQRPRSCTQQRGGDRETERRGGRVEPIRDRRHRTVDHRAVVAEQETAKGGHRGDPNNATA